jgi:hypothetical protein
MNAHARLTACDTMSAPVSASVRVLRILNPWFRQSSIAPSYREIGYFASVSVSRVRTYLDQLEGRGHLTHKPGVERSIVLADRCATISDDELIRALHSRNMAVVIPPVIARLWLKSFQPSRPRDPMDWNTRLRS